MLDLPTRVAGTFKDLKTRYDQTLILRRFGNHYYVYKTSSKWNKENKKVETRQEYLGRIVENGTFIKKLESWVGKDLKRAIAIVQASGGQVIFQRKEELAMPRALEVSDVEKKVMMILSMNARLPVSTIAKKIGLKRSIVITTIRNLENRYGIEYILEIDIRKLGFRPYLILVKFEGDPPPSELIKDLVLNEPRIQFAAVMKGNYDLVMYWLDDITSLEIADNMWKFESNTTLKDYKMKLDVTPFGHTYSFVPLRTEFIEKILKQRAMHGKGRNDSSKENKLRFREFVLINELNKNSIKNFTEIDVKYALGKGASRYSYLNLKEQDIIVRSTISTTKLPIRYTGMILLETVNAPELEVDMYKLQQDIIEYGDLLNKYVLVGNIGIASGSIRFMPVFREGELDKAIMSLRKNVAGANFKSAVITEVLVGSLCYRRFDNTFSMQYLGLVSQKKNESIKLENYEET